MMVDDIQRLPALRLNVPHWYRQADFVAWLNEQIDPTDPGNRLATWHKPGKPGNPCESSDVFCVWDNGEGSEWQSMPDRYWNEIGRICEEHGISTAIVWLTNLPADAIETKEEKH